MKILFEQDFEILHKASIFCNCSIVHKSEINNLYLENFNRSNIIQKEFNDIKFQVYDFLETYLRVNLDKYLIRIYILPEEFCIAAGNCKTRQILLGYPEIYKGYSITTIIHEIIHICIYEERTGNKIHKLSDEVFTYLLAECEFRKQFYKNEYFTPFCDMKLSEFHESAFNIAKRVQIDWQNYLKNGEMSFVDMLWLIEKKIDRALLNQYENARLKDFI